MKKATKDTQNNSPSAIYDRYPSAPYVIALFAALFIAAWLLQSFFFVIILAFLTASITNPLYRFLLKKSKGKKGLSVTLTSFISFIALLIPLILVILLTAWQTTRLIQSINIGQILSSSSELPGFASDAIAKLNQFLFDRFGISNAVELDAVYSAIRDASLAIANWLLEALQNMLLSIPNFFTGVIIFIFVYAGLLLHQDTLINSLYSILPFPKQTVADYITKTSAMIKAMTRGQVIIAILQGVAGALSLLVLGLGEYVFFFAVLFSILNLVPLGSGIITIPLGIINVLIGNIWQGLFILFVHFVIVTNIDNLLKPKLVPKNAKLQPALIILAALAGVRIFGLIGVILGPVLMIIVTTTIEMFMKERDRLRNI